MILGIDGSRANHAKKSGVEWYAWHIIEGLKRVIPADVEVRLYSDLPLKGELAEFPPNWKATVLAWPPKRLWTQVRLSLEMLVHPPDVLFIPAHVPPFVHPKKTVMMVHDVAALRFPQAYSPFERWYSLASARYALRHLWKVITPSEFTRQELIKLCGGTVDDRIGGMAEDKIKVIHHGYDARYSKIEDSVDVAQTLARLGITTPFLLSVGRLEKKKNTVGAIKAFEAARKKLPNLKLKLVLAGTAGYGYEEVKAAMAKSRHQSDILELGWLPTEDMVYLYNGASAFLFPSFYEGFGLPMLEAMAVGTPVIAGRGSSLPEVGGEAAIYVEPGDTEALANGIVKLLTDQAWRAELSSAALARARVFSWEKAALETWSVLSSK